MANDLINREISWLAFNERVLQEAMDKANPLVERMHFLGIYSNNMDEFFRVRVATIKRMTSWKSSRIEGFHGGPSALLTEIQRVVIAQQKQFELTYQKLARELQKEGIIQIDEKHLNKNELSELNHYFLTEVKKTIFPVIFNNNISFPQLRDKEIYLAIKMKNESAHRYALIEIPSELPRFKVLSTSEKNKIILLDDLIRLHLKDIFSIFSFEHIEAYTFKISRDAELDIDDDISLSILEKMERGIRRRKKGTPVRMVYDENMPADLFDFLTQSIGIKMNENCIPGGKYHNFKDFIKFPHFGRKDFCFDIHEPQEHKQLARTKSLIRKIEDQDILLHFPYQTFGHVIDLLREAAIDPDVEHIRISLYRVAKFSDVVSALVNALKNGKKVTVVFELFARFDEKNNVFWSNVLTEQGAKVIFGKPGLKVHSKIILITRKKNTGEKHTAYIGTGNFNGETAKIYEDFGLMTSNEEIAMELKKVFLYIENVIQRCTFHQLLVSPFNTRRKMLYLIDREIEHAQKGNLAFIRLKLNNLVDAKMIRKLYEASRAGVKIQLIVRGICCLKAQVAGLSENIEVISIVGRFLEHSRVLIFANNHHPLVYISSADWMPRNLDKRIEVGTPIFDEQLKNHIMEVFSIQWADNMKARILDESLKNQYLGHKSNNVKRNAQEEFIDLYKEQS
jgi:polyphosphate kinase